MTSKSTRRFRLMLWAVVIWSCAFPPTDIHGQKLDMELWSVDHGLSNRAIIFATRDPNGFLWLVSSDIEKYDGHRFTRYSKFDSVYHCPLSRINTAIQYDDSTLLIADDTDLFAFDMLSGESSEFDLPRNLDTGFSIINGMLNRSDLADIIITTTSDGFKTMSLIDNNWNCILNYQIQNGTPLSQTILRSYANGPSGVLWIMDEAEDIISRISQQGVQEIPFSFSKGSGEEYRIIYRDGFGLLIVGSRGRIFRYKSGMRAPELYMTTDVNSNSISSLHFESTGDLWITTIGGVAIVDLENREVLRFDQPPFDGLRPEMYHIFEDSELTTWYCTELGLVKINEMFNPFEVVLTAQEGERNIQFREIFRGDETDEVICRMAVGKRSLVRIRFRPDGGADTVVMFDDVPGTGVYHRVENNILMMYSGRSELLVFDMQTGTRSQITVPDYASSDFYNQSIVESDSVIHYWDDDDNITILNLKTNEVRRVIPTDKNLLRNANGRVMFLNDEGNYAYATGSHGFMIIDRSGVVSHHYSTETTPAISNKFVNAVHEIGDGKYWLGTLGGGLNYVDTRADSVRVFTQNDGLPNNLIASILEDAAGQIWVATYNGLARLDTSTMTFYNYYVSDGLPENEFNYLSSLAGDDGKLYFGSFNGLVRFDPATVTGVESLPTVKLTRVQKYSRKRRSLEQFDYHLDQIERVIMDPTDNYIELEFAVPAFKDNGSYYYKAKLNELDEDWQDLGSANSMRIRHLPAGTYTLSVVAYDVQGNYSESEMMILLDIRQAIYKAWWFISSVVLLFAISLYLLYKYRLRLIRKEAQTRTRIAVDLHDEIGSSLTRISLQLQLIEQQIDGKSTATIRKINDVVDASITKLRDLVWTVDTGSDNWSAILERMQTFAHDALSPRQISFGFKKEGLQDSKNLNPLDKRNIYLIFKEAVTNISKHSTGSDAWAEIRNESGQFQLRIGNDLNSEGSTEKRTGGGNGLKNLVMRAERIGGKLIVEKGDRKFEVILTLPREV